MGQRAVDDVVLRERCSDARERAQRRRALASRLRRRRLRVRGGVLALAAVALMLATVGAGMAAGRPGEVVLRKGDRGPAVAKVQRKLRLSADGVFGPLTHKAVKRFQRRRRLLADGIVGPQTRRAMGLRPFRPSEVRHKRRRKRRGRRASGSLRLPRALIRIAECESGGNPRAVSPNGRYRGKYQFTRSTWRRLGGRGDPAKAAERTQDRLALKLYRREGTKPWPACGAAAKGD